MALRFGVDEERRATTARTGAEATVNLERGRTVDQGSWERDAVRTPA